jgi:hypothetical protein
MCSMFIFEAFPIPVRVLQVRYRIALKLKCKETLNLYAYKGVEPFSAGLYNSARF